MVETKCKKCGTILMEKNKKEGLCSYCQGSSGKKQKEADKK